MDCTRGFRFEDSAQTVPAGMVKVTKWSTRYSEPSPAALPRLFGSQQTGQQLALVVTPRRRVRHGGDVKVKIKVNAYFLPSIARKLSQACKAMRATGSTPPRPSG